MRLWATRDDNFHWSGPQPKRFSLAKLLAALIVAAGTFHVLQLWAPKETLLSEQPIARDPPVHRKTEMRSANTAEQQKPPPPLQSQPEPPVVTTKQGELLSRTATYRDLREQFLDRGSRN